MGVMVGFEAHVSRESINVVGCEACGQAVFGHQLSESVALVNPAFAFLEDFTLQCVAFQYVAFIAAHESAAGSTAGFFYQKLLSNMYYFERTKIPSTDRSLTIHRVNIR